MQISRKELEEKTAQMIREQFCLVLSELKKKTRAEQFYSDFFTPAEQAMLVKRLAVAVMLKSGASYQLIHQQLKVSSATISTIAEMMKKPGFQLALASIAEEEWAQKLAGKLSFFQSKTNNK